MFLTYQEDNQLSTWWDLTASLPGWDDLKTRVESVSSPFMKFETERKISGEIIFMGVERPTEVSISIRESTSFSTYKYFNDWAEKFYDKEKQVFKTFPNQLEYNQSLMDLTITYYKGPLFNVGISVLGVDVLGSVGVDQMKASHSFIMKGCKPIGIGDLEASYDGGALSYTVTLMPETVEFRRD